MPSNKVGDIERYIRQELSDKYPLGELRMFTLMLFEAYLGWSQVELLLHREDTINQSDLLKFHWAVEDLKKYRPIQHIIGYTEFCGLKINVTPDTLIPRPETEEIVRLVAQKIDKTDSLSILDICTGSGCIALALKSLHPQAQIWGIDISPNALAVAQQNAKQLGLETTFSACDILDETPLLPHNLFDVIVSNPPYIRDSEKNEMHTNVLDYEPHLALFVPNEDPLIFYRSIACFATKHLAPHGLLAFEISEHFGSETCQMLETMGFSTELHKDFRDKDRCILATRK